MLIQSLNIKGYVITRHKVSRRWGCAACRPLHVLKILQSRLRKFQISPTTFVKFKILHICILVKLENHITSILLLFSSIACSP